MNECGLRRQAVKKVIYTVMVLGFCQTIWAATWTVQPNGSGETSLWQALELAETGDEIVLSDGLYPWSRSRTYLLNKDLTLRSLHGPQTCWIDCEQNGFLYLSGDSTHTLTIEGVTLFNAVESNGALFRLYSMSLTLIDCVIRDCVSTSYGGVIYVNDGLVTLERCQLLSNSSAYYGGVIYGYDCELIASNCVFADNETGYYGAVLYYNDSDVTFTHCTFHNNDAGGGDGGLMEGYDGQPTLTNCIISATASNAIYTSDHLLINNCLIYGNGSPFYYNASNGNTYSTAASLNSLSGCSGNLSGQPGFALETDYHLTADSRAVDQGRNDQAGSVDLDGHTRVIDGNGDGQAVVDIGAYEYDPNAGCLVASAPLVEFIRDFNSPNPEPQEVEISNCGGAPITWQALSMVDWLQVDPNVNASQSQTVTVSVDTDGMERGLYNTQLQFVDPNAVNSPLSLLVVLQVRGKLNVPEDFNSIQEAMDAALPGEIVEVQDGTYQETVTIQKPLNLMGAGDPNILGLIIYADDCNVTGFDCAQGSSGLQIYGSQVNVMDVTVTDAATGVLLSQSQDSCLTNVTVKGSMIQGLRLNSSEFCTLRNVVISDTPRGFTVTGSDPNDYRHDIDQSNTVDGKAIYYLTGVVDQVIAAPLADPACLYLVDCEDVVAFRLSLSGNGKGICLVNSSHCTVRMVNVSDCDDGISLENASDNALISNTVSDCDNGITLDNASEVHMQSNACLNNQINFTCTASDLSTYLTHEIDMSNTVDGKAICYLVDDDHETLDGDEIEIGCLYAIDCKDLTVSNQTLSHNGYGAVLLGCSEVSLDQLVLTDNVAAGLWMEECSEVEVTNAVVSHNSNGIEMTYNEGIVIDHAWISYNDTGVRTHYSEYTLIHCMIHHNSENGGVQHYSYDSDWSGTISFCTIFNNQVSGSTYTDYGGGITDSTDYLAIDNSILWGNRPGQIPYPSWEEYEVTYSAVETPLNGLGNISEDPLLTSDGHLTLGSPCIDAGKKSGRFRVKDIDGESRDDEGGIDMGADEYFDLDLDGLPDWLETLVDPNGVGVDPNEDLDDDGYTNLEEYLRFDGAILTPIATYYVDPVNGDDGQDGLTIETAKQSADELLAAMMPGEGLVLLPRYLRRTPQCGWQVDYDLWIRPLGSPRWLPRRS